MKILNTAVVFIVSVIFFSCQLPHKEKTEKVAHLYITDTLLEFELGSKTLPVTTMMQVVVQDNQRYLAYLDYAQNKILLYNIDFPNLKADTIPVFETGTNRVGKINSFFIKSLNTIFIPVPFKQKIVCIDKSGIVKQQILYDTIVGAQMANSTTFNVSAGLGGLPVFKNNKIYLHQLPNGSFNDLNPNDLSKHSLTLELDTLQQTSRFLPVYFPATYLQGNFQKPNFAWTYDDKNFIYSFVYSDSVYIKNNEEPLKGYIAASAYIEQIKPLERTNDIDKLIRRAVEEPRYLNIIYDSFRDVYYRLAYPGVKITKNDNVEQLRSYIPVFSIIILNNKFEVVGEKLMPREKFVEHNFIVTEEGIWFSENHPGNPDFDENKLKLRLLKLEYTDE